MMLPQDRATMRAAFARDVRAGLSAKAKSLPPRWLYDAVGSALFEAITYLPEYYPTLAELEILEREAVAIAEAAPPGSALVEFGAGSGRKTRTVIRALIERRGSLAYRPIDISPSALEAAGLALAAEFPDLRYEPIAAEYGPGLATLSRRDPKLVLFLGSSIGNFEPAEAARFLATVRRSLGRRDRFLLGTDLDKDPATIEAAYDDPVGVTAAFNRNVLARVNRELGGDLDVAAFAHRAFYDPLRRRVEMHLVATRDMEAEIRGIGLQVSFAEGESIHTENSYKFSPDDLAVLFERSGLAPEASWTDEAGRFGLHLLGPEAPA